ncbi:24492_t:CDS:2 [Dentiscutata erythropus]|uniref:24492_t:CDS:1 n=1 Tax=Dentiscutata erythropus TaxID=1348616 RepID=A0A9N9IXW3_9GLOM|nr:24492_t:CDS:2 [Dentiscutata erythropus]
METLHISRKAANLPEFSNNDKANILKIWKEREKKCQYNLAAIEERINNVRTKYHYIQESIQNHTYIPSFANLLKNFGNAFLYNGCHCFERQFATGLCLLCGFYLHHDLNNLIPNSNFKNHTSNHITNELLIDAALDEIFKLPSYREIQRESILSFIFGQDTLALLRTGSEKTLIYSVASHDLVKQGIPAAVLFATSDQPPEILEIEMEVQLKPRKNELFKEKVLKILETISQRCAIIYCTTPSDYGDDDVPQCYQCDNCKWYLQDQPVCQDVSDDTMRIIRILEKLLDKAAQERMNYKFVKREDIVDIFIKANNINVHDFQLNSIDEYKCPTGHIQTRQNVFYLIDVLLVKGLIKQEVELKFRTSESSIWSIAIDLLAFVMMLRRKLEEVIGAYG